MHGKKAFGFFTFPEFFIIVNHKFVSLFCQHRKIFFQGSRTSICIFYSGSSAGDFQGSKAQTSGILVDGVRLYKNLNTDCASQCEKKNSDHKLCEKQAGACVFLLFHMAILPLLLIG